MAGLNTDHLLVLRLVFSKAAEVPLRARNADGLRAVLNSPLGETVPRSWWAGPAAMAAANGDTQCLNVFQECGFLLSDRKIWAAAAEQGHLNCLAFAMAQEYELTDSVLKIAVCNGHVNCVEFLLDHGLPHEPYRHSMQPPSPVHLQCIQLMFDRGLEIDRRTLEIAVDRGDFEFVSWLYERGVPLWEWEQ